MKKSIIIIKSIFLAFLTFSLFYLIGSFFATTFDISKWSDSERFVISMFGGFISMFVLAISIANENLKF